MKTRVFRPFQNDIGGIPVDVVLTAEEWEELSMISGVKEGVDKIALSANAILNLIFMRLSQPIPARALPKLWQAIMETEAELVTVEDGTRTGRLSLLVRLGDWLGYIHRFVEN